MKTARSAVHQEPTSIESIEQYLKQHEQKTLLRLLTCGSVDDGKSTLIGRLLYDSSLILDDQLSSLQNDSLRYGTTGEEPDLALLMDGLRAEREQGITIDVAYRYFSTDRRKVIIADTPGHEQYTRNMVTGASTADLAIILVDAKVGIQQQTCRHTILCSLLGIRHIVLAVNKMDAVSYDETVYTRICQQYHEFLKKLPECELLEIPISALRGDNVVHHGNNMDWFSGPTLLEYLENVQVTADRNYKDLRFPVQYILRPDSSFRGLAGTISAGILESGSEVTVLPSGIQAKVQSVWTNCATGATCVGDTTEAQPPLAAIITLDRDIDVSRGDVLSGGASLPYVSNSFSADIVWFSEKPLQSGAQFELKLGHQRTGAIVRTLQHRLDINCLAIISCDSLSMNEIGYADIQLHAPLVFDLYERNTGLGNAILIDRITNSTVAALMIRSGSVDRIVDTGSGVVGEQERYSRNGHTACIVECSGIPDAAVHLERQLFERGLNVIALTASETTPPIVSALLRAGLIVLVNEDANINPDAEYEKIDVRSQSVVELFIQQIS